MSTDLLEGSVHCVDLLHRVRLDSVDQSKQNIFFSLKTDLYNQKAKTERVKLIRK